MDENEMLRMALEARSNAYVPYSKFPVGAAVLTRSGKIFAGANVDNASYPMTSCAEANAIGAMCTAGEREIIAVLVVGGPDVDTELCVPCGGCRQRLSEFATPYALVLLATRHQIAERVAFSSLLPRAFGPAHLWPARHS